MFSLTHRWVDASSLTPYVSSIIHNRSAAILLHMDIIHKRIGSMVLVGIKWGLPSVSIPRAILPLTQLGRGTSLRIGRVSCTVRSLTE